MDMIVGSPVAHPEPSGWSAPRERTARAVWRAVEGWASARADDEVRGVARQCEALQPELAKELREACRRSVAG